MGLEKIFKNAGKSLAVLGVATGLMLGASTIAGADNKLNDFLRGLRTIERDVDRIQRIHQEQLAQFSIRNFTCNSSSGEGAYPGDYIGIKNVFNRGESLELVDLNPYNRLGDAESVYVYDSAGNTVYQDGIGISSIGQFWFDYGLSTQNLSGYYKAIFFYNNQFSGETDFSVISGQQPVPQQQVPQRETPQEPSQLIPTPQPAPQAVYQPPVRVDDYLVGDIGLTSPTSILLQNNYGAIFDVKAGIGLEKENGFIFETDLEGKFTHGTSTGNYPTAQLSELEIPFKFGKVFGTKGYVRPYIEGKITLDYANLSETSSDYYGTYNMDQGQIGLGIGAGVGLEIPISKNLALDVEGSWSGSGVALELGDGSDNANLGGFSIDVDLKYFFKNDY